MFSFNPRPEFRATVTVWEPGAAEAQTFTGRFRALPTAETERLQGRDVPREKVAEYNDQWLDAIFLGWDDDLTVEGAALAVTPENKALLLGAPWVRQAITFAYVAGISGAARKN